MTELEQSIIATVVYFDLFDFPLTYPELYRYLWKAPAGCTLQDTITTSRQLAQLEEAGGFVFWKGRSAITKTRQQRYLESERKFQKRKRLLWLLSLLPGVEAIFIVNTLAYHNVKQDSDIDLLIIARPGKIWATRFYTTAMAKLLGVRPKPNHRKDTLCLSFYITPAGVKTLPDVRLHDDDSSEAYWLAQAMPVYDPKHYANTLVDHPWLKTVLPNNQPVEQHVNRLIQHSGLHTICHGLGRLLLWNRLLKLIQLWALPKKLKQLSGPLDKGIVVLTDDLLKFHTTDPRPELLAVWSAQIKLRS